MKKEGKREERGKVMEVKKREKKVERREKEKESYL